MTKKQNDRKPHSNFPLFIHGTKCKRWCKKMRGKHEYFGLVKDDPNGDRALNEFLDQKDNILAGRPRQVKTGELTLIQLCNHVLNVKVKQAKRQEIKPISLPPWKKHCELLVGFFGKHRAANSFGPQDFQQLIDSLPPSYLPATRNRLRAYAVTLFKHAYRQKLIPEPVDFGDAMRQEEIARYHHKRSRVPFTADEIRKWLAGTCGKNRKPYSARAMRCMILLGINCGFGNHDCAALRFDTLDLDKGWHFLPRPKNARSTGVDRRCPLWPETVQSLREYLRIRKRPKNAEDADIIFINEQGKPHVHLSKQSVDRNAAGDPFSINYSNTVSRNATLMLRRLGITRNGLSFYSLRHTFRTVAARVKEPQAIKLIMGHKDRDMGSHYNHIDDAPFRAVTDHVRDWLFPAGRENSDLETFARQVLEIKAL